MISVIGGAHILTFFYGLIMLWKDIKRPYPSPVIKDNFVRRLLVFTALIIIAVPGTSYLAAQWFEIPVTMNKNAIFFLPSIFPMILLLFSLRYGFISFTTPIRSFYVRLVYYLYFAFLYWFLVGFQLERFTDYKEHLWTHIIYAFGIIFLFDFLRTVSYVTLNQYLLHRRFAFNEYLSELSKYINNPIQLSDIISRIRDVVISGTGASNAILYVSDEVFEGWNLNKPYIKYLPSNHHIWQQMKKKTGSGSYPYATITRGGSVQALLQEQGGFLYIIFQQFPLGIMFFEKSNKEPYFTEDISFIRNLIRNTEPLLENYSLLINNIKHKRIEKELEMVSGLQRKILPEPVITPHVKVSPFIQPYMLVTGDYVDIIQRSENDYFLILGDVSGHGLASAYLMVAVRSMIHGGMNEKNADLSSLVTSINEMLCAKQSAQSIMTLCAIRIQIVSNQNTKSIKLSYINAGQHAPIIYKQKSKKFFPLEKSQRVLGAIPDNYVITEQEFKESVRIVLTTDGAFEIFNQTGDILGERKFMNWIEDSILMEPDNQIIYLVDKIRDYTMTKEKTDDISMLLADISI
ncbi:MAG: PP2C family protein-serine/threonine phosphatase [Leptospirales bacterium]